LAQIQDDGILVQIQAAGVQAPKERRDTSLVRASAKKERSIQGTVRCQGIELQIED